jgi:ABC-type multidrug transport system fused ATPase/permease subunit
LELKSIRGFQFYGSLLAMTTICGGLGTLLTWVAISQPTIDYTMLLFVLLFLLILVFTFTSFLKNTPIIRLNDEGIKYAGHRYCWQQIKSADFTTQKGFPFLGISGSKPMNTITLNFDRGDELCIFDTMYWNGNEIRNYLLNRLSVDSKVQPGSVNEPIDEIAIKEQKKKTYLFTFFFVSSLLVLSTILVYFNLSKRMSLLFIIPHNILFLFLFKKIFRRRKDVDRNAGEKK